MTREDCFLENGDYSPSTGCDSWLNDITVCADTIATSAATATWGGKQVRWSGHPYCVLPAAPMRSGEMEDQWSHNASQAELNSVVVLRRKAVHGFAPCVFSVVSDKRIYILQYDSPAEHVTFREQESSGFGISISHLVRLGWAPTQNGALGCGLNCICNCVHLIPKAQRHMRAQKWVRMPKWDWVCWYFHEALSLVVWLKCRLDTRSSNSSVVSWVPPFQYEKLLFIFIWNKSSNIILLYSISCRKNRFVDLEQSLNTQEYRALQAPPQVNLS